jgi:hypothetical protein
MKRVKADSRSYPVPYPIHEFAAELSTRLRNNPEFSENDLPSVRKSDTIASLLFSRVSRKIHARSVYTQLEYTDYLQISLHAFPPKPATLRQIVEKTVYEIFYQKLPELPPSFEMPTKNGFPLFDLEQEEKGSEAMVDANLGLDIMPMKNGMSHTRGEEKEEETRLGAGSGLDLIKEWSRDKEKDVEKEKLKEQIKKAIPTIVKKYEREIKTSEKTMGIEEGQVLQKYEYGEDPELIDMDESVENILDQCKEIEEIRYDDFLMIERIPKDKCIVFLLDISYSMDASLPSGSSNPTGYELLNFRERFRLDPLLIASTWTAMLVCALNPRDQFSLAFFTDDTYEVKRMEDEIDPESLVDVLLETRPIYGTMVRSALKWTVEQFNKSNLREKILVMLTDCVWKEFNQITSQLNKIKSKNIKVKIIAPRITSEQRHLRGGGLEANGKALQSRLINEGFEITYVDQMDEAPQIIPEILGG